jgi:hypothetical protein
MTYRLCGIPLVVAFATLIFSTPLSPAFAQAGMCTAQCGGKPGGEAANTPKVVACYRKCMAANDTGSHGRRRRN